MIRYILVEWPDSQHFMGESGCYFCQCNDENSFGALDQAMFVPEKLYSEYKRKEFFNSLDSLEGIEVEFPITHNEEDKKWYTDKFIELGAIPKDKLIVGREYFGHCRNSDRAIWKGEHFEYERYKFGSTYIDKINHFQDDDGYDVFVPIKLIEL